MRRPLLILFGLILTALPLLTAPPAFKVSPEPIRIPDGVPVILHRDLPVSANLPLKKLKAVLLAAPIDGDHGSWTKSEITNMKKAEKVLRDNKVEVFTFYTPQNDWNQIKQAAEGAHFLLYRGHGIYDGKNPPQTVGGFGLKGKYASSKDIMADLKLAPGAIVMLYGCFTAGNSGFDIGKIDEKEAMRRVAMYSEPFIELNSSGYYANWFPDAFAVFLANLFAGQNLGDAYKNYSDFDAKTVTYSKHPRKTDRAMWIDHDNWNGRLAFNNAFVGMPERRLIDLFPASGDVVPAPAGEAEFEFLERRKKK